VIQITIVGFIIYLIELMVQETPILVILLW
jgi:preprotein translocase subunit Sss1